MFAFKPGLKTHLFLLTIPIISLIVPTGQIHPQTYLPNINVNATIIIEKETPSIHCLMLNEVKNIIKGSNLKRSLGEIALFKG